VITSGRSYFTPAPVAPDASLGPLPVHGVSRVVPMAGRDYLPYLLALINGARERVLATIFIIDPRPETDLGANVNLLLETLARARWRGVDVRVITGSSRQTPAIELADRVGRRRLEDLGVPCRPFATVGSSGSLHSKCLVVDDTVVVGSHNWSHQALQIDDELSLAVHSRDLSQGLGLIFEREWNRAAQSTGAELPRAKAASGTEATEPPGVGPLRSRVERALVAWATAGRPALPPQPSVEEDLGAALYTLAGLVAGEPVDIGPLIDPDGLAAYAIMAADQGLRRGLGEDPGRSGSLLGEVQKAIQIVAADPPPRSCSFVLPERAAYIGRLLGRASTLPVFDNSPAHSVVDWAGLVSGSAYLDIALRLLRSARREVSLVMFFLTYRPGGTHPVNTLVEELVAACRRGCRVQVILDLDRPTDPYGSRHINLAAYRYLRSQGVTVKWDDQGWVTHAKLLVVDGRDILCGSHNWTAGSLGLYDDQSLLVRSREVAATLEARWWR
jgi:phosphatidylserine/phosphatidylglycerophosphate/cardiolipin synthase-like enzyme